MDALKFIEEKRRMCSTYDHCSVCPAFRHKSYCIFSTEYGEPPLEQIKFLEKWLEKKSRLSCKYCKEYEDLPEHFIDGNPVGRVFDTCIQRNENGLWHLEVPCGADIGIRFCPMCGRRLPPP